MEDIQNNNFKHKFYNGILLTASNANLAIELNDITTRIIEYKPIVKIFDIYEPDKHDGSQIFNISPIGCLIKSIMYMGVHSFKKHPNVNYYYNLALKHKELLFSKYNTSLEKWEENWITLLDLIINRLTDKIFDHFISTSLTYPEDILSFKFGFGHGLVTGNKEFMKELSNNYSQLSSNHDNIGFIGIKAFILEELREFKESEELIIKGMRMSPLNMQLRHLLAHIMYQTDRIEESITVLRESLPDLVINANSFLHKHINWHLAVHQLETEDYDKSYQLIDYIASLPFEESECTLAILGYIFRVTLRTESNKLNEKYININWIKKMIDYFKNLEIYTSHRLHDALCIWLLAYIKDEIEEAGELLGLITNRIKDNVMSEEIQRLNNKFIYDKEYVNICKGMRLFGERKYKEALEVLEGEEEYFRRIGASDEQLFVLYESVMYAAMRSGNKNSVERLMKGHYGYIFEKFTFVRNYLNNN